MSADEVTGLILAGGESRRFGSPKAASIVRGRPMIEHVIAALAPLCARTLISVGSDPLPIQPLSCEIVRDQFEGMGPLAGLHAGLREVRSPWVLIAACDMPYLSTPALEQILLARTASLDAVVATDSAGRVQPLCATYRTSLLPLVESQLKTGRLSMWSFVRAIPSVRLLPTPAADLRNINTPEDLSGSEEDGAGRRAVTPE